MGFFGAGISTHISALTGWGVSTSDLLTDPLLIRQPCTFCVLDNLHFKLLCRMFSSITAVAICSHRLLDSVTRAAVLHCS